MSFPSRDTDEQPTSMNVTRARQGRWGRHVFWVLVFGTVLAALGMFLAWTWKSTEEPVPVGRGMERVDGRQTTDTPAPPPATNNAYPDSPTPP